MTTAAQVDPHFPPDTPAYDLEMEKGKGLRHALRCLVVTPEATVVDEPAAFVALPLYDGQIGIAPGRTPLIGRLGFGELRIRSAREIRHYFIDGGFVQVRDDVVTVLTSRAMPADQIEVANAQAELAAVRSRRATTDPEFAEKDRAQQRARALIRTAGRHITSL